MTILAIITGILLLSTLICGLWIRYSGEADDSSVSFHMGIASLTVVVGLITSVLVIIN